MIHRVATSDDEWYNEWQRITTSGATIDNEWYNKRQRVTANDNEWQWMTTSDNKWQRVTTKDNERQQMTTSDKEWQRVVTLTDFPFFLIKEEPTTLHPKETLLTLKRILKRDYWSKDKNKPLRRNINRRNQVSKHFSCLWYIQLYTFQKIVWHKISRFRQPWQLFIWDSPWIVIRVREPLEEKDSN